MRAALVLLWLATPAFAEVAPFIVTGDALEAPLVAAPASAARGEAIVKNRETANCLICHAIPDPRERFMGDVGPPLAGVGSRLTPGQIRLRLVDPTRLNAEAIMPAYHRTEGLNRVDPRYLGRPVLTAMEIEDVVAYLARLKE
ncbi:sulfur oxidation c-type cytochrome SoxX [Roseococcus sp. SDR]|uniref:sulfur oxidation c-type cytochrome SoxX n=1 Tax=Roseococcus sp. SDR TaxID=2835532 RepID=UPI001BCCCC11|nr:sulfur oxidation c-type cytochrome SoxX [Roseococcus sp. SDR]MBS7789802.1 sulfur oxidation c-type cytochrome SoxX [Roseococcus sp. SDR]MBV1845116.1 sulfur oxidation c-type cytochrome SoxX [Roseococcus sp. SDR]